MRRSSRSSRVRGTRYERLWRQVEADGSYCLSCRGESVEPGSSWRRARSCPGGGVPPVNTVKSSELRDLQALLSAEEVALRGVESAASKAANEAASSWLCGGSEGEVAVLGFMG